MTAQTRSSTINLWHNLNLNLAISDWQFAFGK